MAVLIQFEDTRKKTLCRINALSCVLMGLEDALRACCRIETSTSIQRDLEDLRNRVSGNLASAKRSYSKLPKDD